MRQYSTYSDTDRTTALKHILKGDALEIEKALIGLAYHDRDPEWVIGKLNGLVSHRDDKVRAAALHCLFLVSRVRGVMNVKEAFALAVPHLDSPNKAVQEAADELLDEAVEKSLPPEPTPLSSIERALLEGTDLEKCTALNELFGHENDRAHASEICLRWIPTASALHQGWCLMAVRLFLLQDEGKIDSNFSERLLAAVRNSPQPYVSRMVSDLESWIAAMKDPHAE